MSDQPSANAYTANHVDGYLVEFRREIGWRCECGDFERANTCAHTTLSATIHSIERAGAGVYRVTLLPYS